MQQLITYLLQAALSLAILHAAYRLFIQMETFHRLNRWILLGSLFLSVLLPAISIPVIGRQTAGMMDGFSSFLLPVIVSPDNPASASAGLQATQWPDLWQLTALIYFAISAILLFRLLFQLAGISRLILRSERVPQDGFCLVISKKVNTPFSFFRYIFLNPNDLGSQQTRRILDHEEVHAGQLHSVDNLLSELYTVAFWFSPISWWHKKEILLNLEYLADNGALQRGCEQEDYQLQLLRASLSDARYALANHFAQSIIKKRIKMMNAEKSPLKKAWKYVLLIPAAATALFLLNCTGEFKEDNTPERRYSFVEVDQKPVFQGGNDKIMDFVANNFRYSAEAREARIQGTVYVQFIVGKDGSVDSVKAVRGGDLGGGLAEEAIRVVKSMPAWIPAEHNGEKVKVSYTLPIFARLDQEKAPETAYRTWSLAVPFADVDKKPQFPGGNDKIMSYIGENFRYPAEAREDNIQGTVYVRFMITNQGEVAHPEAVRGADLGGGLAEEAVRVVEAMPDWTPGEHKGKKVAVTYTLPIFARVQE